MQIESTSNMVNMLEEVAKIASWMTLKSSEIHDYSWIISTVLVSPFCSSSCCQACFPSIVRPMRNLWKLALKIFSPEMNRSVFFSMHLLWMTKKERYFLRYLIFGERIFPWFNINPLPSLNGNDSWWIASKFSSLWFCFCLWSACKIFRTQF